MLMPLNTYKCSLMLINASESYVNAYKSTVNAYKCLWVLWPKRATYKDETPYYSTPTQICQAPTHKELS